MFKRQWKMAKELLIPESRIVPHHIQGRTLTSLSKLYTFGTVSSGGAGYNLSGATYLTPQLIDSGTDIASMSSYGSSFKIASTGVLKATGINAAYQLGLEDTTQRNDWTTVNGTWKKIVVGASSSTGTTYKSIGLKIDGTLWIVGNVSNGMLGDGSTGTLTTFTQIGVDTDWVDVAIGSYHVIALKANGDVYTWGTGYACGRGSGAASQLLGLAISGCKAIGASAQSSFAIKTTGELYSAGIALETGFNVQKTSFTLLDNNSWKSVSGVINSGGGVGYVFALRADGSGYCWGQNGGYELGLGDTTTRTTPTAFAVGSTWKKIILLFINGASHGTGIGLKLDGTLWGWGVASLTGTNQSSGSVTTPAQIGSFNDWQDIWGNGQLTFAIR